MTESAEAFAELAVAAAPMLRPMLRDHVDFYEEIIPHVFFGEVSEWAVKQALAASAADEVAGLVDLLESSYPTADPDVQNLIDVSFVEMVQDEPKVVALFGPNLMSRVDAEFLPKT